METSTPMAVKEARSRIRRMSSPFRSAFRMNEADEADESALLDSLEKVCHDRTGLSALLLFKQVDGKRMNRAQLTDLALGHAHLEKSPSLINQLLVFPYAIPRMSSEELSQVSLRYYNTEENRETALQNLETALQMMKAQFPSRRMEAELESV